MTMRRSCDLVGIAGVVLATGVSWTLWGVAAWLVAGSVEIGLSPLQLVFVTAVVNLGVAIPSSPGYVGTYQWLCVSALAVFGVPPSEAFALSVISHAVWFVPSSLAGLLLLVVSSVRGSARRVESGCNCQWLVAVRRETEPEPLPRLRRPRSTRQASLRTNG